MVRLLIFLFLLVNICCYGQFQSKITIDHIRIDHAGPNDAMIQSIIVTMEKLTLPVPEVPIQVDKDIFDSLSNYIDNAPNLLQKKKRNELGVFKVTKRIGNKTEVYFTGTRKKSIPFLKNFKMVLKDVGAPKELIEQTEKILARIDF